MTTTSATTATSSTASTAASTSATGSNALQQLAGNYNDFLNMLMTQLQNQDPTNPMDSSQFTTELVQFTGVQQQVQTNTNLSQLISLTQGSDIMQSSSMIGQKVQVTSSQIALQNGSGTVDFNTTTAEPITISVTDSKGNALRTVSATSAAGANSWTWDGTTDSGTQEADGAYNISITTTDSTGTSSAVPFTVAGTATGVAKGSGSSGVTLDLGTLGVDMSAVQSVGTASSGS